MSILDRFLLVLLTLGSLCAAVILLLVGLGSAGGWIQTALSTAMAYPAYTIVIAIVFGLLALRFLFYRWGRPEEDYVVLPGDHGFVRISFETIRQLANRTGKSIRGVQEFDTRVRNGQAGVVLASRVRVLPDVELTQMSNEIQNAVKSYVEQTAGVTVERVTVNVVELAPHSANKSSRAWVD
ncbi:alkaline shock response membrane anchor protein AmaP [Alicyclobacillus cycloheptanicus]|uniref:Alkaline shock family protein YloU n=1 Tax=Alicyclobacillus cycloheptanicus TaxID=1457 RepID=A0ABT9XDZ9_9BACL|nr:alkaline shock response membrane anchor protein AmaP [Alicyclobacillus cycloheptanicus]MDQ0188360.1 putative alkaline shock family protein YloU [Alicyclobacillus cycloheptanicus]WDM01068.1 alkaline shock response membrane anchor protein AmaP [Alicyclobacillus cycloheptanicus]